MMFLFSKQTVCYLHGRPCAPSKGFHGLIKLWQVQGKRCAKSETLGMPSHTKHLDWHGPRMYRSSSVASMYIRDRVYSFLANNPQGIIVLIIFSDLCFHHRRTQIIHRRKCLACPIAAMPSPIALFVAISLPWRALTVSFLHSVNFQRPILVFSIGDGWWWELFILSVWERCEERTLRANVVLATFHGQHQGQDLPDQCLLSKSHLECFALKSSLVLQHVILNYRKCIDIDDVYIYIYIWFGLIWNSTTTHYLRRPGRLF